MQTLRGISFGLNRQVSSREAFICPAIPGVTNGVEADPKETRACREGLADGKGEGLADGKRREKDRWREKGWQMAKEKGSKGDLIQWVSTGTGGGSIQWVGLKFFAGERVCPLA